MSIAQHVSYNEVNYGNNERATNTLATTWMLQAIHSASLGQHPRLDRYVPSTCPSHFMPHLMTFLRLPQAPANKNHSNAPCGLCRAHSMCIRRYVPPTTRNCDVVNAPRTHNTNSRGMPSTQHIHAAWTQIYTVIRTQHRSCKLLKRSKTPGE